MVNKVTVAWATPVDAFALGAQIEAHAESKASIHSFRLCVKYAQASGKLLGTLSPELVEIVVAHIRQPFLDKFSAEWQEAKRCCLAECKASDHFDSEVLADMKSVFFSEADGESGDEDAVFEECLDEDCGGYVEHYDNVHRFLSKIDLETGPRCNERFAKYAKV